MDLLETLEALRPLQLCVKLLIDESDAAARVSAEVLVGKALAHEHMRRRRSPSPFFFCFMTCKAIVWTTAPQGYVTLNRVEISHSA